VCLSRVCIGSVCVKSMCVCVECEGLYVQRVCVPSVRV